MAAQHNTEVMKERGGAPWLEVDGRKLKVRIKAETALLPEADALPDLWVNSYFLHSLKRIGAQVTGKLS